MTPELAAAFLAGCFLSAVCTYFLVSRFEKGSATKKADAFDSQFDVSQRELIEQQVLNASLRERLKGREVKVGEGEKDKVLISRYKGKLYAVGAFCSHFGAPLVQAQ